MPRLTNRPLALLLLLAMVASACRAEATINSTQAAENRRVEAPTTAPQLPTPEPADELEPLDEAEPTTTPAEPAPATNEAEPLLTVEAPATVEVPASWNEPLPVDDAVREGVLGNGVKYLLRENSRPGGQAQLRLVIQAGSLNEVETSRGSAHFLEHMMFNGTERFPGNEIVQVLENFGSTFGPDVNAYTSFGETVYELEVPTRSPETLQLALDVLFQWATAATIAQADVTAERGVVREEHRRATEGLGGRLGAAIREVLFGGTDYLGRDPIGSGDVIDNMSAEELRAFYEQWYRPELMTIVAVGDFDVAGLERRIAETFIQPASPDPIEPRAVDVGDGLFAEPVFDVITDAEINQSELEVIWRLPNNTDSSQAAAREAFVRSLAFELLDDRLFEQVQRGDTVAISAGATSSGFLPGLDLSTLRLSGAADQVEAGLVELLTTAEQARQFGFSPSEFERRVQEARALLDQGLAQRDTLQDSSLAAELVDYALGRDAAIAVQDRFAIGNEILDTITLADVQGFLFEVLDSDPYVLLTAPASDEDVLPTPEDLADAYYQTVGRAATDEPRDAVQLSQLMEAPAPATVSDVAFIDELGASVVTYENGARLAYRQTNITDDAVFLYGVSPGGHFAVEGAEVPLLTSAASLISSSGFESIDVVALDRFLATRIARVFSSIDRADESIRGESSSGDIETMFQLMHLQMTQPTITDVEVRQFDERLRPLIENVDSSPDTAARAELWRLRYGDSPWFRFLPTIDELDSFDPDAQLAAYKERFANAGDFVFVVVGDFDPEELTELGARYIGTLPDNGVRETPIDRDPGVPEDNLVATVAAGIGDQGSVRINWESPYPFTIEANVIAEVLEIVVNARLRDLIREELGASYSPNAAVSVIAEPKPWVDTIINVESDPERVAEVSAAIRDELDRIRAGEIDQVYVDAAIEQLREDYRFFTNRAWLDLIAFHMTYPDRSPGENRSRSAIVSDVTIEELAVAAQIVFPPSRSVEVRLVPAAGS